MSTTDAPTVSVVIPVKNDTARLRRCLDALRTQRYPSDRLQVIVVDNGSDPVQLDGLRRIEDMVLIRHPYGGSYAARNVGQDHVRGTVVAFTDSDCTPDPDWVRAGVACLHRHSGAGVVAGRVELTFAGSEPHTAVEAYEALFAFRQRRLARRGHGVTANWFSWKSVLEEVGRFDASLYSNGDTELAARISASGSPVVYCREAMVKHPARRRLSEIRRKSIRIAQGNIARIRRGSVRGALVLVSKNIGWHLIRCAELLNHLGRRPVSHLWNAFLVSHVVMAARLKVVAAWVLTGRRR